MHIDENCILDILLVVERLSSVEDFVYFPDRWPEKSLNTFSESVIRYHIRYCFHKGYLLEPKNANFDYEDGIYIIDLSPKGREYLETLRSRASEKTSSTFISKAKSFFSKIGCSVLLDFISSFFKELISKIWK